MSLEAAAVTKSLAALRTLVRSLARVDSSVHLQVSKSAKLLPAEALVGFFSRVHPDVPLEVAGRGKRLPAVAVLALEGLVSVVYVEVHAQARGVCKGPGTHGTLVGSLSRVYSHVALKPGLHGKRPPAFRALELGGAGGCVSRALVFAAALSRFHQGQAVCVERHVGGTAGALAPDTGRAVACVVTVGGWGGLHVF